VRDRAKEPERKALESKSSAWVAEQVDAADLKSGEPSQISQQKHLNSEATAVNCSIRPYYQHAGITIYHGDCREILPTLPIADLLLTDPPYGIQMSKGFGGSDGFDGFGPPIARRHYPDIWDKDRPDAQLLELTLARCDKAIIWGGNFFADLLPRSTHWISWDKLNTMPSFGDCELAWTNIKRKSVKKFVVQWNGLIGKEAFRDHPTQKPLELMRLSILHAGEVESVLDPFLGSGTSLLAAKELGLNAVGIEIEEKYCEIAAKRLSQEVFNFGGGE
jgi:site-specific DNA-methyltransferase (adenine-specific)